MARNIPTGGILDIFRNRVKSSKPSNWGVISLSPNPNTQYYYQEKQSWPWPSAPAHEQRSALVNNWTGNQLPGPTNFIPGVSQSYGLWNIPTSYANTLKNTQYNSGYNIGSQSSYSTALLQQIAQLQWQNRVSP